MKNVELIVRVPSGDFCWEGTFSGECCEHFDNHKGYAVCDLDIGIPVFNPDGGYIKPKECKRLKDHE